MKLSWSDVTPEARFLNRRAFIAGLGVAAAAPALAAVEEPNSFEQITNYNNFYEFGFGKTDPAENAGQLTTDPWAVEVGGLVDRPGSYSVADLAPENAVEERIYRLRCVEAWSMVIPWMGVPLASVLDKVGVQPGARFVAFETLLRPEEMPEQRRRSMDWPYREGLRLDEAMHPLTILATGLYGKPMPNQNGAPIRLVVPWKYGFKSIKSIVKITLTDSQPVTTWQAMQPREYGFYANVNPQVDHPRWSQATERRIGAGLFGARQDTLMFNGYGDQVAQMYAGMDLARDY
ncbi:protein-methionine-sulfoxide reductase catalytic subunit MsrP [Paracoccus sp. MC1854]|uniref:protein-methionine-sulfoxide reductase catalytic subunit MsrP n=1 Tax=Paracoccus sp. MC1854 TaxID=2760306 RepID=UPI001600886A|nr:protein-methionine-sulfoxide reductase catalytic subunit MsrP [Paracoccus sp. MC1854]MBB1492247.1 protein-methionine-sulfoxide reductase catalytic subunit MsrP [Paracoccus sp. MC1854]